MHRDTIISRDGSRNEADKSDSGMLQDNDTVKQILKERFLREYILGLNHAKEKFDMFCESFSIAENTPVHIILFSSKKCDPYDDLFRIVCEAKQMFSDTDIILGTVMGRCATFIIHQMQDDIICDILNNISQNVRCAPESEVMSIYSRPAPISDIAGIYRRIRCCMEYAFYSDKTEVICEADIQMGTDKVSLTPQYVAIEQALNDGDKPGAERLFDEFFSTIEEHMPSPAIAKTYCLELYACIIRCCGSDKINNYMQGIESIQNSTSFGKIKEFIRAKAMEIVYQKAPRDMSIYSSLVKDTMRIIDENIGNERLSLRWIAKENLFTNVDYLGKIFKRETGINFSHYVMEKRMELAKELIMEGKRDRIYEVAERVGYGSNSQYFSQVFKKYTGSSPLEYREVTRLSFKRTG